MFQISHFLSVHPVDNVYSANSECRYGNKRIARNLNYMLRQKEASIQNDVL